MSRFTLILSGGGGGGGARGLAFLKNYSKKLNPSYKTYIERFLGTI